MVRRVKRVPLPIREYQKNIVKTPRYWTPGKPWVQVRMRRGDTCSKINGIDVCYTNPHRSWPEAAYWYLRYCPPPAKLREWRNRGDIPVDKSSWDDDSYDNDSSRSSVQRYICKSCRLISDGWIRIHDIPKEAYIAGFFITETTGLSGKHGRETGEYVRGTGTGPVVYGKLETWLKRQGVRIITLSPMDGKAEHFWNTMGFKDIWAERRNLPSGLHGGMFKRI